MLNTVAHQIIEIPGRSVKTSFAQIERDSVRMTKDRSAGLSFWSFDLVGRSRLPMGEVELKGLN